MQEKVSVSAAVFQRYWYEQAKQLYLGRLFCQPDTHKINKYCFKLCQI